MSETNKGIAQVRQERSANEQAVVDRVLDKMFPPEPPPRYYSTVYGSTISYMTSNTSYANLNSGSFVTSYHSLPSWKYATITSTGKATP